MITIDTLRPGDVAVIATPPAFRWVHFKYAIEKGVNVFMEKPICVDGPSGKRMLELGEQAKKKNETIIGNNNFSFFMIYFINIDQLIHPDSSDRLSRASEI